MLLDELCCVRVQCFEECCHDIKIRMLCFVLINGFFSSSFFFFFLTFYVFGSCFRIPAIILVSDFFSEKRNQPIRTMKTEK